MSPSQFSKLLPTLHLKSWGWSLTGKRVRCSPPASHRRMECDWASPDANGGSAPHVTV
jgi:hypothetical protein